MRNHTEQGAALRRRCGASGRLGGGPASSQATMPLPSPEVDAAVALVPPSHRLRPGRQAGGRAGSGWVWVACAGAPCRRAGARPWPAPSLAPAASPAAAAAPLRAPVPTLDWTRQGRPMQPMQLVQPRAAGLTSKQAESIEVESQAEPPQAGSAEGSAGASLYLTAFSSRWSNSLRAGAGGAGMGRRRGRGRGATRRYGPGVAARAPALAAACGRPSNERAAGSPPPPATALPSHPPHGREVLVHLVLLDGGQPHGTGVCEHGGGRRRGGRHGRLQRTPQPRVRTLCPCIASGLDSRARAAVHSVAHSWRASWRA